MIRALKVLALAFLVYLPGLVTYLAFFRKNPPAQMDGKRALEILFCQISIGLSVGALLAFVLATSGVFTGWTWTLCIIGYTALLIVSFRPSIGAITSSLPFRVSLLKENIALILILILALALFAPPFMSVFGQTDESVYPNVASQIRENGSVFVTDTIMRDVKPDQRDLFYPMLSEGIYWQEPGFFVDDFDTGAVRPQFLYFYPSLMAAFMVFLGPRGGFLILTMFALLSVWAAYLIGKELFSKNAGLLAALLFSVTFLQVYFSKSSLSNIPAQFFFLMGIFFYLRYMTVIDNKGRGHPWFWGSAAALGFTSMMLTHTLTWSILIPLIIVIAFIFVDRGSRGILGMRHFLLLMIPGAAIAILVSFLTSTAYIRSNMERFFEPVPGGQVTLWVSCLAIILLALLLRGPLNGIYRYIRSKRDLVLRVTAVMLGLAVVITWFVLPHVVEATEGLPLQGRLLSILAYYLTPLGLILATIGYCLFIIRRLDHRNLLFLLAGLLSSALFVFKLFDAHVLIFCMRRSITMLLPAAVIMAAYALWEGGREIGKPVTSSRGRILLAWITALAAVVLVVWSFAMSMHVTKIEQTQETYQTFHRISDIAEPTGAIVMDAKAGKYGAAPLRYFFDREVAALLDNDMIDSEEFDDFLKGLLGTREGVFWVVQTSNVAVAPVEIPGYDLQKLGEVKYQGRSLITTYDEPTLGTMPYEIVYAVYGISPSAL